MLALIYTQNGWDAVVDWIEEVRVQTPIWRRRMLFCYHISVTAFVGSEYNTERLVTSRSMIHWRSAVGQEIGLYFHENIRLRRSADFVDRGGCSCNSHQTSYFSQNVRPSELRGDL